ncbi:MAG: Haloalkane dehalogenase [Alphaproteobacteria bacterium MarineAlpha2_Bin1]|nr:MAG: Haloalkane dehalogenase [Alphaproteobacteria bacterium MarineAlpha2_Bin1]
MKIIKQYLTFSEYQIHLRKSGDSGFPLILLHQTPLSSRMFELTLPYIGKQMQAIAFDTPGYGQSSPLNNKISLNNYANRINYAIDSLGFNKFALASFATGSALAIKLANKLGNRVTHLILSGTPVLTKSEIDFYSKNLPCIKPRLDGSHLNHIWKNRINSYGSEGGIDQLQMVLEESLSATGKIQSGLEAVLNADIKEELKLLNQKVLFLTLENDKLAISNRKAASFVKHSEELIIPDSLPQYCWTNPERYAQVIFDFVLG